MTPSKPPPTPPKRRRSVRFCSAARFRAKPVTSRANTHASRSSACAAAILRVRPACCCRAAKPRSRSPAAGRGGRNTEYLLALALECNGLAGLTALACDTDGIDGTEVERGRHHRHRYARAGESNGLSAEDALARNDAYGFFHALGDLVTTGPTRTNVNDFRAILLTESRTAAPASSTPMTARASRSRGSAAAVPTPA